MSVPTDSAGSITVSRDPAAQGPSLSVQIPALEVSLPTELDLRDIDVAADGTAVYQAADGGTSAAVQVLENGDTRVQTVIPDAAAQHTFTYTFGDDIVPIERQDGGVDLTFTGPDAVTYLVGTVATPWAVDASANPVDTGYRVENDQLVQYVTPGDNTAYPVVADPRVSFGTGIYIYMKNYEMATLTLAASSIAVIGGTYACGYYGKKVAKIPGAEELVKLVCGWTGVGSFVKIMSNLPKKSASYWTQPCYEIKVNLTLHTSVKSVASSNC